MIKRLVLAGIKLYQQTRIFRRPSCRFFPSCSDYAHGCIRKHGLTRGVLLTLLRICRCQPLHPGGIDEVPEKFCIVIFNMDVGYVLKQFAASVARRPA